MTRKIILIACISQKGDKKAKGYEFTINMGRPDILTLSYFKKANHKFR